MARNSAAFSGTFARKTAQDSAVYPYLCCEMGGGMAVSYHRRVDVTPADVESTALVKIG